jgi:hypothetical protein
MRFRASVAWALGLSLFASGCSSLALPVNSHDSTPNERTGQMLNTVREDLRIIDQPSWTVDQPTHLTPDRVHGGIGP